MPGMAIFSWRTLQLPPSDRAYWRPSAAESGPLLYLAWGARHFGSAPIATTLHDGWVYTVIEKGNPLLMREADQERIAAPALLVIGPDCASGWTDEPRRSSRLLLMWRRPRHPALAQLDPTGYAHYALGVEDHALLGNLHALTRREAQLDDTGSQAAIKGLQLVIEAHLARVMKRKPSVPENKTVNRALQWLQRHLDSHQPLARLADYLALSPSTVQRLFRQQLRKTVIQVVTEMRCSEAERMIAGDRATVKTVAYRLGYRHPHDFSRAYRRATGSTPSSLGGRTTGKP